MNASSAAVVDDPQAEYWDARRHREGGDGRSERFESARQRTVILTFDTPEDAAAWDDAGQPLTVHHQNSSVIAPTEAPRRLADLPTTSDRAALPPSSRPVVLSRHEVPSPDDCPPFGMLRPPLEVR